MRKVLIIGATSAIAQATARCFASRGDSLYLTGRNPDHLQTIADDLKVRGAANVTIATLDVVEFTAQEAVLNQAERELGGLDIALIAHGSLPDQVECQNSVAALRREFDVNALSTLALLTDLANRFEKRGSGTLAVISSVAGDRGRQRNYVYGSAKGAVSIFLSGLRQRLTKAGVHVITIKPGFVDTPMTREFKKNRLWAQPERIALGVMHAIDHGRDQVYLPWFWAPMMFLIKLIPEFVFKRMRF